MEAYWPSPEPAIVASAEPCAVVEMATEEELSLLRRFEGLRLHAYRDPRPQGAIWTIGYGHTGPEVGHGQCISREQAEVLLAADAQEALRVVTTLVSVALTRGQRAALVSFVFNVGAGKFAQSNVLRLINRRDFPAAARALLRWCHAGTTVLPGLRARRQAELWLFTKPDGGPHAEPEP